MRGAFDDEEDYVRQHSSGDAEFTLGAGTLLLLVVGLLVLCVICFGAGYMIGHRGPATAAQAQQTPDAAAPQTASAQSKPSATLQTHAESAQTGSPSQPVSSDLSQPGAQSVTVPTSTAQGAPADAAQPQVRPALPAAPATPQTVNPYPSRPAGSPAQTQVRPATEQPAVQLWVQIAAVSRIEDAQVLTKALQRRGYNVTPRREADNLIHVRIGPFGSRDEATRWRSKLLDDGYNAEIQQ